MRPFCYLVQLSKASTENLHYQCSPPSLMHLPSQVWNFIRGCPHVDSISGSADCLPVLQRHHFSGRSGEHLGCKAKQMSWSSSPADSLQIYCQRNAQGAITVGNYVSAPDMGSCFQICNDTPGCTMFEYQYPPVSAEPAASTVLNNGRCYLKDWAGFPESQIIYTEDEHLATRLPATLTSTTVSSPVSVSGMFGVETWDLTDSVTDPNYARHYSYYGTYWRISQNEHLYPWLMSGRPPQLLRPRLRSM